MMLADASRIVEAAIFGSNQPLTVKDLLQVLDNDFDVKDLHALLLGLQTACEGRGVELVRVASGWRYQTRPEIRPYLDKLHPEKPPKYSRATLETLAIIAYRQPVTRADMEAIRGVTVNSLLLKQLEDRGWVEVIGHRDTVGRPALFVTTQRFLDDLGLTSLDQLPTLGGPLVDRLDTDETLLGLVKQPSLLP